MITIFHHKGSGWIRIHGKLILHWRSGFVYFSERYGYNKPILRIKGWRLFLGDK